MLWLSVVAAESEIWTADLESRRRRLEVVYEREAESLVRLARIFTDDRASAEDIVQEAFIRLFRSFDRIAEREKCEAYLRSIVLNLSRDHNRRGLMSLRHQNAMIDPRRPEEPHDIVTWGESQAEMLAALRDLSPRQRDCLVLRYYLELSEREIAETLDISPNSVKTHCRRGLAALAGMVGG